MTAPTSLYQLLPAIYRVRDGESSGMLQNLCAILQDAHDALDADIARLYENWFIETCAEWAVPYLGDLLGARTLAASDLAGVTLRAYVASTLAYRSRKGTAVVLEQLAHDITNWPALAVEGFQLLAATQYMQHLRPAAIASINLRDGNVLAALGGPWDRAARTADLRAIETPSLAAAATLLRGKPNLNNVAIFLWRLAAFALEDVTPRPLASPSDGRFHFHPAGIDAPLYGEGRILPQFISPAGPADVPSPLLRRDLSADLEALRQSMADSSSHPGVPGPPTYPSAYFADAPVLAVTLGGLPIPPQAISICDLSDIDTHGHWRKPPTSIAYTSKANKSVIALPIKACVDPVLGRLLLTGPPSTQPVAVSYAYGFSAELGGGPYDRTASLREALAGVDLHQSYWQALVDPTLAGAPSVYADLPAALTAWNAQPAGTHGVIALPDSRTHAAPTHPILIPAGSSLLVIAARWPSLQSHSPNPSFGLSAQACRPHILGDLRVQPSTQDPGALALNGLLLEGSILVGSGNLGRLSLTHCTLIPSRGHGSIRISAAPQGTPGSQNASLALQITRSITGPIFFPDSAAAAPTLTLSDSIVDAAGGQAIHAPQADATLSGCTILGTIGTASTFGLRTLSASNVLFERLVHVERVQSGCLRYCSLSADTVAVPRRFRCQPDLVLAALTGLAQPDAATARLVPAFTSLRYGNPAYAQLSDTCAAELRAGADDGSEIGAFHFLQQPQRDSNLRSVLQEYLRPSFGAGIFYVS